MKLSALAPLFVLTAVTTIACGPPRMDPSDGFARGETSLDGGEDGSIDEGIPTGDGGGGGGDVPADRGREAGPRVDGGGGGTGGDPCSAAELIDLNTAGTRSGAIVRYEGSNATAQESSALTAACASGATSRVRAFRYVPRAATRLRFSTDNDGTDEGFDTVVWAQTACAPSDTSLACNDDGGGGAGGRGGASTAITEMAVAAGTPVFVFVASFGADPPGEPGSFALTVTEVAQVAAGGACDPEGALNYCAAGSTCVQGATPGAGTCVAAGGRGANCRETAPRCDAMLVCNETFGFESSRCVPVVPAGGACDVFGEENSCASGTSCEGDEDVGRCVTAGASGGLCRPSGAPCDTGLACSDASGRCHPTVAVGALCDELGEMNACAAGSACIPVSDTALARCVADGARDGRCRMTGAACETGLGCNDDPRFGSARCRTAVPAGARCDGLGETNACAAGSFCFVADPDAEPVMPGTCIADGARDGRCRTSGAACETGLACAPATFFTAARCRTAVAPGAACDPNGEMNACAPGAACLGTSGAGAATTCVLDGSRNARCRASAMAPCESGLACNGPASVGDSRCRTSVAMGAACDPTGEMNACAPPLQCTAAATATGATCQPPPYAVAPLTGPDATFVDACAVGMRLPFDLVGVRDDGHPTLPARLPFTVRFFGTAYTSVWPSSNGYAVFGTDRPTDTTGGAGSLPSEFDGPLVAPFWQDLALRPSPTSDLCVATVGTAPARRTVLQWSNAQAFGSTGTYLDFEVALSETGAVDFLYRRLDATAEVDRPLVDGSRAAVGMQSGTDGRFVTYTGALRNGSALRFTPR